ncbi:MAG: transglutaminase family protein [Micropruina sp.]
MTTQLRIVHRTGYTYAGGVSASHNEVRMTPRASRQQYVRTSRIDISPLAWVHSYVDYWGTTVNAFEIRERHQQLNVVATSVVDVTRREEEIPGASWDDLRSEALRDRRVEMLELSHYVDPGGELRRLTAAVAAESTRPADVVPVVVQEIQQRVKYLPGSTHVRTRAVDVWEAGAGVCQDMVHVAIGALRSVGIPARYVSGYVIPDGNPVVGESQVGESHAWLQYWDGAWVGLDPTNDSTPGDHHVEVGIGRDYADVPPLRGIYTGAGESDMYVEVEMTILA